MHNEKKFGKIAVVGLSAFFFSCSDNTQSTTSAQPLLNTSFNSYEELITTNVCNENVYGSIVYVAEDTNYICTWNIAGCYWTWWRGQEHPYPYGEPGTCNTRRTEEGPGYVTDINGPSGYTTTYRTVAIGNQVWMAEDLNFGGCAGWSNLGTGYCAPQDGVCEAYLATDISVYGCIEDTISCIAAYSRPIKSQCPKGWHLPKDSEWMLLAESLADSSADFINHSGYVYYISKDKLAEFGFSINFCGEYGPAQTFFWTSSLGPCSGSHSPFFRNYVGGWNMCVRTVNFHVDGKKMTMNVPSGGDYIDNSSGKYGSSPNIERSKARYRCVKD